VAAPHALNWVLRQATPAAPPPGTSGRDNPPTTIHRGYPRTSTRERQVDLGDVEPARPHRIGQPGQFRVDPAQDERQLVEVPAQTRIGPRAEVDITERIDSRVNPVNDRALRIRRVCVLHVAGNLGTVLSGVLGVVVKCADPVMTGQIRDDQVSDDRAVDSGAAENL
jgi:hypothetical protein